MTQFFSSQEPDHWSLEAWFLSSIFIDLWIQPFFENFSESNFKQFIGTFQGMLNVSVLVVSRRHLASTLAEVCRAACDCVFEARVRVKNWCEMSFKDLPKKSIQWHHPAAVPGDQCTDRRGVGSHISKFVGVEVVYSTSYSSEWIVTMFWQIMCILCTYHIHTKTYTFTSLRYNMSLCDIHVKLITCHKNLSSIEPRVPQGFDPQRRSAFESEVDCWVLGI